MWLVVNAQQKRLVYPGHVAACCASLVADELVQGPLPSLAAMLCITVLSRCTTVSYLWSQFGLLLAYVKLCCVCVMPAS